jgi:uncharacterized protein YjiS (DUF1127 family)
MGAQPEFSSALRLPWRVASEAGALLVRSVAGIFIRVGTVLARAQERSRQRYALMELDDHMLRDIGLERDQAEREWSRPFWNV